MSINIQEQLKQVQDELRHLGSCLRTGKTEQQQADMDARFFELLDQQAYLKREQAMRLCRAR